MELSKKNVAAIVAHPDDETIGCGGFLLKAAAAGANCRVVLPIIRADERGIATWGTLLDQFKNACHLLGAAATLTPDPIEDLHAEQYIPEIVNRISEHVNWADIVLTHWPGDMHQAHQALARAVALCSRPFRTHKSVLAFEIPTATDQPFFQTFSPNCFIRLSDEHADRKIEAMSLYTKEQVAGRAAENLEYQLRSRGNQIGCRYAEAFVILRHFIA